MRCQPRLRAVAAAKAVEMEPWDSAYLPSPPRVSLPTSPRPGADPSQHLPGGAGRGGIFHTQGFLQECGTATQVRGGTVWPWALMLTPAVAPQVDPLRRQAPEQAAWLGSQATTCTVLSSRPSCCASFGSGLLSREPGRQSTVAQRPDNLPRGYGRQLDSWLDPALVVVCMLGVN